MSILSTSPRRALTRIGAGVGIAVAATIALPGIASAHVTVQPGTAEGGDFSVVAFRVPNERDDASTTRIRVTLPKDQPVGSVQTTATPGWKVTTGTRKLAQPIDFFGEKLDTVVSQVTWTATSGGIRPGQFQDFDLSLGPLPKSGQLVFNAQQTYSNSEQVNWNEVSADKSVEPEHPAPTLKITPAGAAASTAGESTSDQGTAAPATTGAATQNTDDGTGSGVAIALAAAALAVSVLAALLAWRRGRPAQAAETTTQRKRNDASV